MAQIIVTADRQTESGDSPIVFRERVSVADLESEHFAAQLVERLGWAVGDAHAVEREPDYEPEPESGYGPEREPEPESGYEPEREPEAESGHEPEPPSRPVPALTPVVP
jgi:hypothetical protein